MTPVTTADEATSARYITGLTQLRSGQIEAAIATLRAVLARDPTHAGARRNLIRALAAARDHAAVIAETTCVAPNCADGDLPDGDSPDGAELLFLRGSALNALSRPTEARDALTRSLTLNPTFAPTWLNLCNALMDLDDPTAAEAHCRRALSLDPDLIEAHVSLGFILTFQGRLVEAIATLEAAIRTRPDNVHAHWNLAAAALLAGDLPRGFAAYEWRKRHDLYRRDFINLPGPIWDGDDPRGRTILVHAEQGLGDTIQFARYLASIEDRGGIPVLACEPSLIPLLKTIGRARVVSKFDPLPRYDAWIDQMSLPHVFRTALHTIPFAAGYLSADPVLVAAHRATLPPGPRIGLAWAGHPLHRNDRRRTPSTEHFIPLAKSSRCISLIPDRALPGIDAPARRLIDYAETAALISALDLVITVDTSVAHVAGALGRPAWVLLPFAPDWRWLLNRNDTPWYDSVRLFRQPSPGDWASVIAAVAVALAGPH